MDSCKNKFLGKKVFLFAPGPSLNDFDKTIIPSEYLKAGVNGVIIHKEYQDLDLYFWSGDIDTPKHPTPSEKQIRKNLSNLKSSCIKFTNPTINKQHRHPMWGQTQIKQSEADQLGFISYDIAFGKSYEDPIDTWHVDINKGLDAVSICYASCQILLYMGIKEIVLVGFDCTSKHSYTHLVDSDVCDWKDNQLVDRWIRFKNYVNKHFPDVQIKIVNPQGLKGVFPVYN
jgi:hypothetical protein